MEIHFLKELSLNEAELMIHEYIDGKEEIVVTENIEEVLEQEQDAKVIWCHLTHREHGDVLTTMEFMGNIFETIDFLDLGKWLAKEKGIETIAEYQKDLGYAEWNHLDKNGDLHIILEDLSFEYPDGEDGIKLAESK